MTSPAALGARQEDSSPQFDWLSEYRHIEGLFLSGQNRQVGPYLNQLAKQHSQSRYFHILLGVVSQGMGSPHDAVKSFEIAATMRSPEELPKPDALVTNVYIEAQLGLPPQDRPATRKASEFFQRNLQTLKTLDPELAGDLEGVAHDPLREYVDLWGQVHLFNRQNKRAVVVSQCFIEQIQPLLSQCIPLALTTAFSGQELIYLLEHQTKDFLLGRKRIIYLFEPDLPSLWHQLHLADVSRELQNRELVLLAGERVESQIDRFFGTLRYPPPERAIGDDERFNGHMDHILRVLDCLAEETSAEAYYESAEFARRLRDIAEGRVQPRILISTCRWTTFLQYCAKDFQKAFDAIGCQTVYQIEEGDTQAVTSRLHWQTLDRFRPDAVFGISHARPSFPIPRAMPVISFVQDRCGPIMTLETLSDQVTSQDLFVCMLREFRSYLVSKGVPADQTFTMPVPADETMFYPLPDENVDERYRAEVGFVKHADACGDGIFDDFLKRQFDEISDPDLRRDLIMVFSLLYRWTCENKDRRLYEDTMLDFILSLLSKGVDEQIRFGISQYVRRFCIYVFGVTWRYHFIEALDRAGVRLGLYGNHWEKHPRFKHLARGPVNRNTELNKVYNFNQINLNIHPTSTMHQRINECALAGGFMLNADHDEKKDWESVRPYYEPGREIIMFDTAEDLVDKCRYYLAHPQERMQIALNFRKRALAEQTTRMAAQRVLDKWRELLRRTLV